MTETSFEGQSSEMEATDDEAPATVVNIETLRRHRQIVQMQEWLQAQLPWQRGISQKVSERIRAA